MIQASHASAWEKESPRQIPSCNSFLMPFTMVPPIFQVATVRQNDQKKKKKKEAMQASLFYSPNSEMTCFVSQHFFPLLLLVSFDKERVVAEVVLSYAINSTIAHTHTHRHTHCHNQWVDRRNAGRISFPASIFPTWQSNSRVPLKGRVLLISRGRCNKKGKKEEEEEEE